MSVSCLLYVLHFYLNIIRCERELYDIVVFVRENLHYIFFSLHLPPPPLVPPSSLEIFTSPPKKKETNDVITRQGGQLTYSHGERVTVNCTAKAGKPRPQLSWLVNGREVSDLRVISFVSLNVSLNSGTYFYLDHQKVEFIKDKKCKLYKTVQ